ncbi:MAG: hypothetical protein ACT4PE_02365 [Candidatus Eiseniibacteriota bacterium]
MSVIAQSRATLDKALVDSKLTVLLLLGPRGGREQAIHDLAQSSVTEPWRRTFLVTAPTLLTAAEFTRWFKGSTGRYTVIGGTGRVVAASGACSQLLRADGGPSIIRIRQAFVQGDLA